MDKTWYDFRTDNERFVSRAKYHKGNSCSSKNIGEKVVKSLLVLCLVPGGPKSSLLRNDQAFSSNNQVSWKRFL